MPSLSSLSARYSRRDQILGAVACVAFLGGRGVLLRGFGIEFHVVGSIIAAALLSFGALELLRGASRWVGLCFAATFVGVVLGMTPVAETFATWTSGNTFAKFPQLSFPISGAAFDALDRSVLVAVIVFPIFILTGVFDLLLMLIWMLITALLSGMISLIAPFAATTATVFLGGVFFVLFRITEAPLSKQR